MRTARNKGFFLTFALVALALCGVVLFVLTDGANTILFHADTTYLQAVERNLVASGLAWARANISEHRRPATQDPVSLDTATFAAPSTHLVVSILDVRADKATVRIGTTCSKGRRTLSAVHDYTIDLR